MQPADVSPGIGAATGQPQVSPSSFSIPSISMPKGGGSIRGIGEKFGTNPVSGTASITVPLPATPGRSGFSPQLSLSYDSGSGNGPFGFGWSLSLPSITRKTDKGLPRYQDSEESDVFILSGAEDLVPVLLSEGDDLLPDVTARSVDGIDYLIARYRPRIEGVFARIERWTRVGTGETHWRSISRDNVTSFYGRTSESRIADPEDPRRAFSWLLCESRDDRGNAILYEYISEDSRSIDLLQANECNRTPTTRSANRYLKRIRYGNRRSHLVQPDLSRAEWLFELVFDYDEGHYSELPPGTNGGRLVNATTTATRPWSARSDPFSTSRAGFEVRNYRLCRRVMMFHHFPDELGVNDYLVSTTEFQYQEEAIASFITSITQSGYARRADNSYLKRSLPALEFAYSRAVIQDEVQEFEPSSIENLPSGLDGGRYQWVDLDGEGIAGILSEQASAWFYKPNLGGGRFGATQVAATIPSIANLSHDQQLMDLAGDGQLDLVQLADPSGFHERTVDGEWSDFKPFDSIPAIDWNSRFLRFIDLTGDGHSDLLVSEDNVISWYPSLGEAGFGPREAGNPSQPDEERGPRVVFTDITQSIFLADMCGDGLTDLVRIRNGQVCYWPNLGYGRFGAKVTMDDAPRFDTGDQFDPSRLRLADIDGSGVTDILYLQRDQVRIYFNQSGNSWSAARITPQLPHLDDLSQVTMVDLLGNGTACLVWSSTLPGDARSPMRYIDLIGGQKPHLLIRVSNNTGAETTVLYASSTQFYLSDKTAGRPWITRLPFPVHVVERVETLDRVSRNRFVTRYVYHHGYFDGVEREFRGFGMVEQFDTEEMAALNADGDLTTNTDPASNVPPVWTKTWFHVGASTGGWTDAQSLTRQFARDYHGADRPEFASLLLPDSILPSVLSVEEEREACRALKGSILRQEIYALDETPSSGDPYRVSERNYTVQLIQPQAGNRFAVFFTHPRETIDYQYERNLTDPRIAHELTLEVDAFGNVLRSAVIAYGRGTADLELAVRDREKQAQTFVTCTENRLTNSIELEDDYRAPLPCENRIFELTGMAPITDGRFQFDAVDSAMLNAAPIAYEAVPSVGLQRRLLDHSRILYRRNDLSDALPLGELQSLALPFESYMLAFTPGLLQQVYDGRIGVAMLAGEGGYVHSEGDDNWWSPSGRSFYSPSNDEPESELAIAREHFFLPRRFRDPFHTSQLSTESFVRYDRYDLLVEETRDALDNRTTAGERDPDPERPLVRGGQDYRALRTALVMDPNRNRTAVAFDAFGNVVGTAIMGKPEDQPQRGDSLAQFEPDLPEAIQLAHLQSPFSNPDAVLQRATTRLIYDPFAYQRTRDESQPQGPVVYTITRETHDADLELEQQTRIQHGFAYSDGFGREIQRKVQAEPGPVPRRDESGNLVVVDGQLQMTAEDANPRWVGSAWTIFNNKGQLVRQFEPFFTDTHRFEADVRVGVSSFLFYDPVGRVVAGLHPDHSWEKSVFNQWRRATWDVNDTVLIADPRTDSDVRGFFERLAEEDFLPGWHAQRADGALGVEEQSAAGKAAVHAATPTIAHFDALGHPFLTAALNRFVRNGETIEETLLTRVELDIEGNQREVIDAQDRTVLRHDYNILGVRIHSTSIDAGERWVFNDVSGKPIRAWDSRGHSFRTDYDVLRRPLRHFVQRSGEAGEALIEQTVYGEGQPNDLQNNLRTRVFQLFDAAGIVTSEEYDFKGNLLRGRRELTSDYRTVIDWAASPALEPGAFATSSSYDALNRTIMLTTPDNSRIRPVFNEANLLERVEVDLNGAPAATTIVNGISYNAKGQRELIEYGNGVRTTYAHDPLTFRLRQLQTSRGTEPLQDLSYTYDPAGNITMIRDDALQTIFFNNQVVDANGEYTYDALYRLIEASGREHIGQISQPQTSWNDEFRIHLQHPNDGQAMRRYSEQYEYDQAGNILELIHQAQNGSWTRAYSYEEPSPIDLAQNNNRLSRTTTSGTDESYAHDAHGNMTRMPHLPLMRWNHADQLEAASRQVNNSGTPETTYYVYDAAGQRVRKVTDRQAAPGQTPSRRSERIYLGNFEIFREFGADGETTALARETLHIMDSQQRVALIEIRTQGNDGSAAQVIRYQLGNHLGSSVLELDETGNTISYEEYYPYGSTSYQAGRTTLEVSQKRYRFTGKERDDESGLQRHGARYYAPWLGRWASPDPLSARSPEWGSYTYAVARPVSVTDRGGLQPDLEEFRKRAEKLEKAATKLEEQVTGVRSAIERIANDPSLSDAEKVSQLEAKQGVLENQNRTAKLDRGLARQLSGEIATTITTEFPDAALDRYRPVGTRLDQLNELQARADVIEGTSEGNLSRIKSSRRSIRDWLIKLRPPPKGPGPGSGPGPGPAPSGAGGTGGGIPSSAARGTEDFTKRAGRFVDDAIESGTKRARALAQAAARRAPTLAGWATKAAKRAPFIGWVLQGGIIVYKAAQKPEGERAREGVVLVAEEAGKTGGLVGGGLSGLVVGGFFLGPLGALAGTGFGGHYGEEYIGRGARAIAESVWDTAAEIWD